MSGDLGNKEIMARNIKRYMKEKNVNSADMCRILGVPQSTFSYWLNARTYPRIDKIEMMATFFGITKSDLVEEEKTPSDDGERISTGDLKFALFGGDAGIITDDDLADVMKVANIIRERRKRENGADGSV